MSEAHGEIGRALNESNERWSRHVHEVVEELTEKHRTKIALLERHQAEAAKAIRENDILIGRLVKALRSITEWGETVSFVSDRGIEIIGNAKALLAELQRDQAIQRAREGT